MDTATQTAPQLLVEVARADLLAEAWAARERGQHLVCQRVDRSTPEGIPWTTAPAPSWDEDRAWIAEEERIAIYLGRSGLAVLDIDPRNGGSVPAGLPKTQTVRTGGGGWHIYFAFDSSKADKQRTIVSPGVELLAGNSIVPVVGSMHHFGTRYEWELNATPDDCELAPLPDWLAKTLKRPAPKIAPKISNGTSSGDHRAYFDGARKRATEHILAAENGTLNNTTNKEAFSLAGLCHLQPGFENEIIDVLMEAATAAGLPPNEARTTIRSGINAGKQHPREIPERERPAPAKRKTSKSNERETAADVERGTLPNYETTWVEIPPDDDSEDTTGAESTKKKKKAKKKALRRAIPLPEISRAMFDDTRGWPNRLKDGDLFLDDDGEIHFLESKESLFAYLGDTLDLQWATGLDSSGTLFAPKGEYFEHVKSKAKSFQTVEVAPHEPAMDRAYYAWKPPTGYTPNGRYFDEFLSYFYNNETEHDNALTRAMFLTLAWGGMPGTRPAFVNIARCTGDGKTTRASAAAALFGGAVEIQPDERTDDKIATRLLSPGALPKRIVLLDNLKRTLSSSAIEGLITCTEISGHRHYCGESTRPNTLIWILTSNSARLSRDLSERSFFVSLTRPESRQGWRESLFAYIRENRGRILADILRELRMPPKSKSTGGGDRWQPWIDAVLARATDDVDGVLRLTKARRGEHDDDAQEADLIGDALARHAAHTSDGFLPSTKATEVINEALKMGWGTRKTFNVISEHINAGRLPGVTYERRPHARGFIVREV